jgi:putative NIF3 family GTP cyclohydrolase 1 type 2
MGRLKVKDIYELAVRWGMESDPRGKAQVKRDLRAINKEYKDLKADEKKEFDQERLTNPYADTRILYGDGDREVRGILIGIDMEVGEVLVAERLREKGEPIDLIISHHPEGYALAGFYDVMHMQADILNKYGVPITVAEDLLSDRIKEVERKVLPVNHNRAVDVARLFDIPFMCIHTPCDNLVTSFLQSKLNGTRFRALKDILDFLKKIPEYRMATADNAGPKILVGKETDRAGKVMVEMTGGTEGSKKVMERLSQAGVGTIVGMHMGEAIRKEAEKNHIKVIIAGHMASDTLGMNLFLDRLTKIEKLKILPLSGFRRVKR